MAAQCRSADPKQAIHMRHVSPEELIEFVRSQNGLQLSTKRQLPFRVQTAGDGLEYIPLVTGAPRVHELKWLRRVCAEFSKANSFRPGDYKRLTYNASYTLPLIRAYLDSAASEPKVEVSGGGFPDPATRKEIETAAIAFVTSELIRRGFEVRDHQRENRGYDLLAVAPSGTLQIEVKGTDSQVPRFFLTRNEWRCSNEQASWRLFTVCSARSAPFLHEFTSEQMLQQFTLEPLYWECLRKDS